MNRIIKKSIAYLLAFGMIFGQSAGLGVPLVYAVENLASSTDFSGAESLNITEYTTIELHSGETLIYSTITIGAGKHLL